MTDIPGGVTIIENNPATQSWAEPGDVDLDNFTEFETYINIPTERAEDPQTLELRKRAFPGNIQNATPIGVFNQSVRIQGEVKTITEKNGIMRFFHRHGFRTPRIYLIILTDQGYNQFFDFDGEAREYAPGYIENIHPEIQARRRTWAIRGIFQVTWI